MTYTLGTVNGRGIRSVNYIYTEEGVTLTVTLTDDTTTEFTIPKGDKGDTGDTGVSITGVELVSRTGLTDLYVIRFSDGTSTNFSVTNGRDAVVDSSMDSSSTNALENRVITNELVGIHSDLDTKFNEKDILQLLYDYGHVSDGTVSRITLVSDKDILSYADGDVATLTATVYDNSDNPVSNQIVVFYKNGKVLDTGVTDANGEATYEYESEGAGDITFGASVGSLVIEIYEVHDGLYGNTGASVGSLEIDSGVSCTSDGSYITITKNTSGEKYVKLPITTPNGDWEFSSEIAELGTTQYVTFMMGNAQYWGTISNEGVFVNLNDSTSSYSHTASVGDVLRLRYVNGVLSVYVNDTQLKTKTVSISNLDIGYYTNQGRVQKIKNIMLKPL